jgi:hypothetical protein
MDRLHLAATLGLCALISVSCAAFKDKRTPSGDFCSDMPIIPAGQEPDREYHRLQPIQSDPKTRTEAERLESLRKVACTTGADAVIEAVNEEVRGDSGYQMVSSGTAVIWLRPSAGGGASPHQSLPTPKKPTPIGEPTATAEPAPTAEPVATATPAPAKSGKPAAGKPPAKKPTPIKN